MTLYIIRHGETEFNKQGIVQGSGVDSSLNETGIMQAGAFYETYQHIDFDLIVTSTLMRTHQTVSKFIDRGTPWIQKPEINEISWGDHEGLMPDEARKAQFMDMLSAWKSGDYTASLPGGESANDLSARVTNFVDWVKNRPESNILIATHGRTMRCLVTLLKGVSPAAMEGVPHLNTGLYKVQVNGENIQFDLENDTSHLPIFV